MCESLEANFTPPDDKYLCWHNFYVGVVWTLVLNCNVLANPNGMSYGLPLSLGQVARPFGKSARILQFGPLFLPKFVYISLPFSSSMDPISQFDELTLKN